MRVAGILKPDLIVLGSDGRKTPKASGARQYCKHVVRHAPCPVLIVIVFIIPLAGRAGKDVIPTAGSVSKLTQIGAT
jgi:Universal stress protein family